MQRGSITKCGQGWRGYWTEDGKRRGTKVCRTRAEVQRRLAAEILRLEQGTSFVAPCTFEELAERFLAQYLAAPQTVEYARRRLKRPLDAFGQAQASDLTSEVLQAFLVALPPERVGKAFRADIARTLRMVYKFGVEAGIVSKNPAAKLKAPAPVKSERIIPFESWDEVDRVAAACGRWGPIVQFMAATGARPAEVLGLEHRHVDGNVVELPGHKTDAAHRSVHMTSRGVAAIKAMPHSLATEKVFNIDGRPISWVYFWREVWRPALATAELPYRAPYNLRHTFAYWSLRAGVPIAALARDMGHTTTEQTFKVYGCWSREMGADAAALREKWEERTIDAQADSGTS